MTHIDLLLHKLNTACFVMKRLVIVLNTDTIGGMWWHS